VALNDRIVITNRSAGEVLQPSDRPRLWASAQEVVNKGGSFIKGTPLGGRASVMASYRPVVNEGVVVGVLVQFSVPCGSAMVSGGEVKRVQPKISQWCALTRSEREVAEVVAAGLTNREAGKRLYMSPLTIDSHLRHIFRKLDIKSRVELARFVGQYYDQLYQSDNDELSVAQSCHAAGYERSWSA